MTMRKLTVPLTVLAALICASATAQPSKPWMNAKLDPDKRADLVLDQMTLDEQILLVHGEFPRVAKVMPQGALSSAGFVPGIARLGVPALTESDASLGVATAHRENEDVTPLPSGTLLAATWDPKLAFEGGAMIGEEARRKGFNVLLAGGVDLVREPRNGRNFEYLSEDPLLSGVLDGASIRGIQSRHIVSTAKHFAINDQETGRQTLSANIDDAAARESDLLAFQIAIETGKPGSIMCSYNRVNGTYACENPQLLNTVLKGDWAYRGWVMSDWGAVHSVDAAKAGLDQESGQQLDKQVFFDAPLKAAVEKGEVSRARLRDMDHRILRSMFAAGLFDNPIKVQPLDVAADAKAAGRVAEQGIVLLKNDNNLLPLRPGTKRIAVIGSHADFGVLSGGGSSQLTPKGSLRLDPEKASPSWSEGMVYHASSPLKAIQARAGGAEVTYNDGTDVQAAATLAKRADVVVLFLTQWATEGADVSLTLAHDQDRLAAAVAAANPHTVVVLETGGPVLMPWLGATPAVVEAWYSGAQGGEAIAKVLFGEVNPSGRLPVTFPASEAQLPHPKLPGDGAKEPFDVTYSEGSDVGYRWFARTKAAPLFPFGHGLSYTGFKYAGLKVTGGRTAVVSFTVTNTGQRAGIDTPQLYLTAGPARGPSSACSAGPGRPSSPGSRGGSP